MKSGLRWEAQVRTNNGAITSYVRVRAKDATQAVSRAQQSAWKRHVNTPDGAHFSPSDWFVIWLALHDNDIGKL